MSDYFQIEDRCVVQPDRDGPTVRVDVEIEVRSLARESGGCSVLKSRPRDCFDER